MQKTQSSSKASNNKQLTATTTRRQWQLLSELKRKTWTGTKELQNKLKHAGFDISLRTVQRDLNQLSQRFPIESNGSNPQGWRWTDDAPQQNLPQMSLSEAVAFHLVEANLRTILPESFLKDMQPWFTVAKAQLAGTEQTNTWLNSIRIVPATQPLIGAEIKSNVQNVIYEGLMLGKQISASYQPKNQKIISTDDLKHYMLNPLALVQRGVVVYLICTKASKNNDEKNDIRMFALHRFYSCTLQKKERHVPKNFDIDDFLKAGYLGFKHANLENTVSTVTLIFDNIAGKSLLENKLSEDQETTVDRETKDITLTAKIALTSQLVWWLRGFGKGLKHIQPENLAKAVWENE